MKEIKVLSPQRKAIESNESHFRFQNSLSIDNKSSVAFQIKSPNKILNLFFGVRVFLRELHRPIFEHLHRSLRLAKTYMADGSNSYVWVQDRIRDEDLRSLFESQFVYKKLTSINGFGSNTGDAVAYAEKIHEVWDTQTNLVEKVLTRLEILNAMRDYNEATRIYLANANGINAEAENSQKMAVEANTATANAASAAQNLGSAVYGAAEILTAIRLKGVSASETMPIENSLSSIIANGSGQQYYAAQNYADAVSRQAATTAQSVSDMQASVSGANETVAQAIQTLKTYGISPENDGDDFEFPTLSLKTDIDTERVKNSGLKYAPIVVNEKALKTSKTIDDTSNLPDMDAKVVYFLKKYANDGYDVAQFNLGMRYLEGKGVPKDHNKAIDLFKKAAAQGNDDAKNKLNELGVNSNKS